MIFIRFLQKNRDKAKGNGHHHGDVMHWNAYFLQGLQQRFQSVRQLIGRGGQRHDRRSDDQIDQPDSHAYRSNHPFPRDSDDPEMNQRRSRRENHVKKQGNQEQYDDRFQSLYHKTKRDFRKPDHCSQKNGRHQIADPSAADNKLIINASVAINFTLGSSLCRIESAG